MFGYIKPVKCELKVKEYDYYRAAYCGLCNALKQNCGIFSRFVLSYDFVFLALLLSENKIEEKQHKRRCMVCPKGRMCVSSDVYDFVSDFCVILSYLKIEDDIKDNRGIKRLFKAYLPKLLLRRSYKRAEARNLKYVEIAKRLYNELSVLEAKKTPSIDATADKFALMLTSILDNYESESKRIYKEILYHIGRYIYIIDALDDFENDIKSDEYNPIAERYNFREFELSEEIKKRVVLTLQDSHQAVLNAFELLPRSRNESILRNIIELGMNRAIFEAITKEKSNDRSIFSFRRF